MMGQRERGGEERGVGGDGNRGGRGRELGEGLRGDRGREEPYLTYMTEEEIGASIDK